jgi:hypothetical protein
MRWRFVCALFASLLVVGSACGGRSIRHGEGDAGEGAEGPLGPGATGGVGAGATGGVGATGGTGTGGNGMAGTFPVHPPLSCERNGAIYAVGDRVEDPLLCEACTCANDGVFVCTHCNATCRVQSSLVDVGQSLLMPDGCTTCLCTVNGMDCNSSACAVPDPCQDVATEYQIAVGAEQWCGREFNCIDAIQVPETIPCGCPVIVRNTHTYTALLDQYVDMGCPAPPFCEKPCPVTGPPYRCGEAGFCVGRR